MKKVDTTRMIKSEDLNHHGTLFAGRMAEWFVETTYAAAASMYGKPENLVFIKLHGLKFSAPSKKGDLINIRSRVVHVGKSSITVYGDVMKNNEKVSYIDGFVTLVCIDENGKSMPHNLVLEEPANEREAALRVEAKKLLGK